MRSFCLYPFNRAHLTANGNVYVCCQSWLNMPLGNFWESNLPDIWNSEAALNIRESILDGSFRYCRADICPRIIAKEIEHEKIPLQIQANASTGKCDLNSGPGHLSLNYDNTCNLHCRSCRTKVKSLDVEQTGRLLRFQDSLLESEFFRGVRRIVATGAGEPFASKVFMELFQKLDQARYPELKITIRSNGILLTPSAWEQIRRAHYAIDAILISVDAATKETYQILRRGGDFGHLMVNLKFLAAIKQTYKFKLGLNFVVQETNFEEMPLFVKLGRQLNCDEITFTQLMNLGTFPPEEFRRLAVHQPEHPRFPELKRILGQPIFREPGILTTNLSHLLDG